MTNIEKILSLLHLIKGNGINVVYNSLTMKMIIANQKTYNALLLLKNGIGVDEVSRRLGILRGDLNELLEKLAKDSIKMEAPFGDSCEKIVDRITLHVSNDCNLRCKYCYANGGNYNQERELMSLSKAEDFVDFCTKTFDRVGTIVFFGGEPLLNLKVMQYVCREFKQRYAKKQINSLPSFGIITNGTILNDEILSFIKEHLSFVTVSIDGIGKYNDANRVFANGKGSYGKISRFIHELKDKTNVKLRYEATYTQYHIEQKYSREAIAQSIEKEFGIDGEVVDEMSVQPNALRDFWEGFSYTQWKNRQKFCFPDGFWSVLNALRTQEPILMCGIGHTIFAVAVDGEIYPCHINTGNPQNRLGNIVGKNIFNDVALRKKYFPVDVEHNESCISCWANSICGGCSRTWFYQESDCRYLPRPKEELCLMNKSHLEKVLLLIAQMRADEVCWKRFLESFPRIN